MTPADGPTSSRTRPAISPSISGGIVAQFVTQDGRDRHQPADFVQAACAVSGERSSPLNTCRTSTALRVDRNRNVPALTFFSLRRLGLGILDRPQTC